MIASGNVLNRQYNMKGKAGWRQSGKGTIIPVQTVDEHCMIIRKNSKLKFDERTFDGFHCYGPDICLNALSKGIFMVRIVFSIPIVPSSGINVVFSLSG